MSERPIEGPRSGSPRNVIVRGVDCVRLPVPDLDAGLAFYRDKLGHRVVWRSATAAGLRLAEGGAELVLQTERPEKEIDLLVDDADAAAARFVSAGGSVTQPAFDIAIGRCVVVEDPWGNELVLVDDRNGALVAGTDGSIVGTTR